MHGISTSIAIAKHGIKLDGESGFSKRLAKAKRLIITWMYAQQSMIQLIFKLRGQLTIAVISQQRSVT